MAAQPGHPAELPVGGVFINYRGSDSRGWAPLLYAELSRRLGSERVFLDSISIPPGADFVAHLVGRLQRAWVVLALIGPDWLMAGSDGRRRIDRADDWIRRELALAFSAGTTVLPVLVEDAVMPAEDQLPAELARLSRCQYRRLRHREARTPAARSPISRFGAAWVTQSPVGWAVIPARCTRRCSTSTTSRRTAGAAARCPR
jgi:hypothetical protein